MPAQRMPPPRRAAPAPGWERRRLVLLGEYERVALELFAERGYRHVTMDDIAGAAGVTTRTLFRYFPSKQDCLLGLPRRGLAEELDAIAALEPSDDPLAAAWAGIRVFLTTRGVEPHVLHLWRRAAEGADDVVARLRGERTYSINAALTEYCERSLGVRTSADPRPRLMAGLLTGIELALAEVATREPELLDAAMDAAAEAVRGAPRAPGRALRRTPARTRR